MNEYINETTRRRFLATAGAAGLAIAMPGLGQATVSGAPIRKPIPGTGEPLTVIGLGTYRTFEIDPAQARNSPLLEVLRTFFDRGGQVIDSSPMYGSAEAVTGRFDLMQIHNLRDWQVQLETLLEWKAAGKVRYIGITTSHGRYHAELEQILQRQPLDFVQLSYNIENRTAEQRLLPIARERGIATLINRPYQRGSLFRRVRGKALPAWASEIDCASWGQFFLKFIAGHPAVTCVIPATSKVRHMVDNMGAAYGRLPDAALRRRMLETFENI